VGFLATASDSPTVRSELRTIESALEGHRDEQAAIEKAAKLPQPRVHPAWVENQLHRLDELLGRPQRAKAEILKHLEGHLEIVPRPSLTGERRAEIRGRAKSDSPLTDPEAVCLPVGAGARNHFQATRPLEFRFDVAA
jgi:hypothetical protein